MSQIRIIIISLSLCLFFSTAAYGHKIVLKNGKIIRSSMVIEKGTTVAYERFGGMIEIPSRDVAKIVYSKKVKQVIQQQSKAGTHTPPELDLEKKLLAVKQPKNMIERANMCSVYIKTVAGFGSGFFISDDGLIVTNRHVVRGSDSTKRRISKKIADAGKQFKKLKDEMERRKKRIDKYEQKLARWWKEYSRYKKEARTESDRQYLKNYRRDLLEYEDELRINKKQYQQVKEEYNQKLQEFSSKKSQYKQIRQEQEGQFKFTVTLADGTKMAALLYKISDSYDLALLKIKEVKTPYLRPAKKNETALGDPVYAVGSPLNLTNSVTSGVLSSYRKDHIQTNAEIYPGNSGGPLITKDGKVIGVNTLKLVTEKFEGLGFAIHIDLVFQEFARFLR